MGLKVDPCNNNRLEVFVESILEQIDRGIIWDTPGGVHPQTNKSLSTQTPIERLPLPQELVLPIKQHIGSNGKLIVEVGQHVLKGQPLTEAAGHWSVPIHAPTSGTVLDIKPMPSTHPSALPELSIILEPDGADTWCELSPWPDFHAKSNEQIVDRIHQAGISGMGGAGFPAYVKAQPTHPIEYLIINGVECEPFITADDMLMREHAEQIIRGIEVLRKLYQPTRIIIAIEDDKPQAIAALTKACEEDHNTIVRAIPTKYPSGGEKQLIQVVTSMQVPRGGLPSDVGVVVHNVGTIFAIYQAIFEGKPLIERVVTLAGDTLSKNTNAWLLLGTPIKFALTHVGFVPEKWQRVIMGGPMMGFTLPSVRLPIIKTSNCVLAPSQNQMPFPGEEQPCIRCGACADACPATLLPQQLLWYAKSNDHQKLQDHKLSDCIECGACAFVCPSEIPLVEYYRVAKADIKQAQQDKIDAERAKERFEARNRRLEREKEERNQRHQRGRRQPNNNKASETKKTNDAVQAALARAKAKKADAVNDNDMAALREERKRQAKLYKEEKRASAQETSTKEDAVAAAVARAKAKKQANASSVSSSTANNETEKESQKDAVAAAIARAKAKKIAKNTPPDEQSEPAIERSDNTSKADDPRKAAVAAAIARAKAKKAAKEPTSDAQSESAAERSVDNAAADDPRKAAVAAAIARAKAKKAAKEAPSVEQSESAAENSDDNATADDPRKAAVAAAIARAKAKKAAKEAPSVEQSESAAEHSVDNAAADDPRKAAVAASIARAKAKKAAKEAPSVEQSESSAEISEDNEAADDPRKTAVAAAIARAKAKKAAKEAPSVEQTEPTVESSDDEMAEDPRKAAVAAAIARAKAKKAAKEAQSKKHGDEN